MNSEMNSFKLDMKNIVQSYMNSGAGFQGSACRCIEARPGHCVANGQVGSHSGRTASLAGALYIPPPILLERPDPDRAVANQRQAGPGPSCDALGVWAEALA